MSRSSRKLKQLKHKLRNGRQRHGIRRVARLQVRGRQNCAAGDRTAQQQECSKVSKVRKVHQLQPISNVKAVPTKLAAKAAPIGHQAAACRMPKLPKGKNLQIAAARFKSWILQCLLPIQQALMVYTTEGNEMLELISKITNKGRSVTAPWAPLLMAREVERILKESTKAAKQLDYAFSTHISTLQGSS